MHEHGSKRGGGWYTVLDEVACSVLHAVRDLPSEYEGARRGRKISATEVGGLRGLAYV